MNCIAYFPLLGLLCLTAPDSFASFRNDRSIFQFSAALYPLAHAGHCVRHDKFIEGSFIKLAVYDDVWKTEL
jgi:hypothetical protein